MIRILLLLLTVFLVSCSKSVAGGSGSGSEVTNGFTIGIASVDGESERAVIRVRPRYWYPEKSVDTLSDSIRNAVTDADGKAFIEGLRPGEYRLSIFSETGKAVLFDGDLPVGNPIDFGTVAVVTPGTITGIVDLSESGDSLTAEIQLEGTDITAPVNGDGTYEITGVPSGLHRVRVITSEQAAPAVESQIVELDSGAVVTMDTITPVPGQFNSANWLYHHSWVLNATMDSVTGDSLSLLLRIPASQVDLSGASSNGADLRITDSAGVEIPFELIAWNDSGAVVSLIQKNVTSSTMREITVHWGNSSVQSASNPAALNDTSAAAVLTIHGEEMGAVVRHDATLFGNSSTIAGQNGDQIPVSNKGVVGMAISFDGVDDYSVIPTSPSLSLLETCTISMWVYYTRKDSVNSRFLSKLGDYEVKENNGMVQFSSGTAYALALDSIPENEWTLVTITVNLTGSSREITIYQNGRAASLVTNTFGTDYDFSLRSGSQPLFIGSLGGNESHLLGKIDEMRILNRLLSPEEIYAQYQSEKPDATLFQRQ